MRPCGPRRGRGPGRRAATGRRRAPCCPGRPRAESCRGTRAARRRLRQRLAHISSGAPRGATLSRSGSSSRRKSWNTAVRRDRHEARSSSRTSTAVDLDRAALRVVQPAEQLRDRRLAGAVLTDDGQRRTGRNRQVESIEHRRAAWIRECDVAKSDVVCRQARCRAAGRMRAARRRPSPRSEPAACGHRGRGAVERPVEPAERDERRADAHCA